MVWHGIIGITHVSINWKVEHNFEEGVDDRIVHVSNIMVQGRCGGGV